MLYSGPLGNISSPLISDTLFQPPVNELGFVHDMDFDEPTTWTESGEDDIMATATASDHVLVIDEAHKYPGVGSDLSRDRHFLARGHDVAETHYPGHAIEDEGKVCSVGIPLTPPASVTARRTREKFDSGKLHLDPHTEHIKYDSTLGMIDVSKKALLLSHLIAFIELFQPHDKVLARLMNNLYFGITHHSQEESRLRTLLGMGHDIHSTPATGLKSTLLSGLESLLGSLFSNPDPTRHTVRLDGSTYIEFIVHEVPEMIRSPFPIGSSQIQKTTQLTVIFHSPLLEQPIVMGYNKRGNLIYTRGQMRHFYGEQFPQVARPNALTPVTQAHLIGPRETDVTKLTDMAVNIRDLGGLLTLEALDPFTIKLLRYDNREAVESPTLVCDKNCPLSDFCNFFAGAQLYTNFVTLGEGSSNELTLDSTPPFGIRVAASDPHLTATTNTLWHEIARLNKICEQTQELTYSVSQLGEDNGYSLLIYVWNRKDHEWQRYGQILFDRYAQRIVTQAESQHVPLGEDRFVSPTDRRDLRKTLEAAGIDLKHVSFYMHRPVEDDRARRKAAEHAEYMIDASVAEFLRHVATDEEGFFDGTPGQNFFQWVAGSEVLSLAYVSFHVSSEVRNLIRDYMGEDDGTDKKRGLQLALLDRFSFGLMVEHPLLHGLPGAKDIEDRSARQNAAVMATRIHDRHAELGQASDTEESPAFTIMLKLEEGVAVMSGGTPPRNRWSQSTWKQPGAEGPEIYAGSHVP